MKSIYHYLLKIPGISIMILYLISYQANARQTDDCSYTWITQSSGTTNLIFSLKAVNELICWAAGANSTVRKTTDGGITWLNGNPNPGVINGDILNIEATDENNALATTTVSLTYTYIYRTTNGGNNWIQVYSGTGGIINGLKMISPSDGFAFGSPVSNVWNILRTTDGGASWSSLPSAPAAQIGEQGFRNSFHVSPPNIWFGAFFGKIYRSTNLGINWTSHETTGINTYIFEIHFNSSQVGLAGSISMVKSTNSGTTYFQHPAPGVGNINGIEGLGNDFWIVRGTEIFRSTNDGVDWMPVHTTANTQLALDFPDNLTGCLTGWSAGYAGVITKMTGTLTGTGKNNNIIPTAYKLMQNYPNPFNPVTKIKISLKEEGKLKTQEVKLIVYDVLGKEIATLVNEQLSPGTYEVSFDGTNVPSGIYFYKLITNTFSDTKKMLLIK